MLIWYQYHQAPWLLHKWRCKYGIFSPTTENLRVIAQHLRAVGHLTCLTPKKCPSWCYNIGFKALNYRPVRPRNKGFISFNQLKESSWLQQCLQERYLSRVWSLGEQHSIIHRNMAGMQTPVEFPNCIQLFQEVVLAFVSFIEERYSHKADQREMGVYHSEKRSFPSLCPVSIGKSDKQVPSFPTAR